MLGHRTLVAAGLTAAIGAGGAACAAELVTMAAPEPAIRQSAPQAPAVPPASTGVRPDVRSLGLRLGRYPAAERDSAPATGYSFSSDAFRRGQDWTAPSEFRPEDLHYGLTPAAAIGASLKATRASFMHRTGWNWSGRLGPLRWLGPVDSADGEMLLSLRRVPGQPRAEGLGKFHVSIHYTFE